LAISYDAIVLVGTSDIDDDDHELFSESVNLMFDIILVPDDDLQYQAEEYLD
jgi:hypothetical protein